MSVQLVPDGHGVLRFFELSLGEQWDGNLLAHNAQAQWWSRRVDGQNGSNASTSIWGFRWIYRLTG